MSPQVAGTAPDGTPASIGVRCGLLDTLEDLGSPCLAGTLAGVAGVTNATGLATLNTVLGINRTKILGTWSMAPTDAIEAWRKEAQTSGVYSPASTPVPGYGDDISKSVSGDAVGNECFLGTPNANQVIFIEKVGNGEQYCNVPAGKTAKIIIVERGAIRIKGAFTGVVYALNKQECGSDGTCTRDERNDAVTREVVRLDGPSGKVSGAVWADGARGAVGIYPSFTPTTPSVTSLLGLGGGATGICGLGLVGSVVSTLNSTLSGLSDLVSGLLSLKQVRNWDGTADGTTTAPGGCSLLKSKLDDMALAPAQLLDFYATGGSQTVITTIHRTRASILSPWSAWTTKTTSTVAVPALLTSALPSVVDEVAGLLGAGTPYTAVTYNNGVVTNSTTNITQGASPVVGTYRNVASIAPPA